MSKEKQIEEMARITKEHCQLDNGCGSCHWSTCNECLAEVLYNAGYSKQGKGEWLLIKVPTGVEMYGIREVQAYPKCSICGYMGDVSEWHFKYCPNCGAKMKGGKAEEKTKKHFTPEEVRKMSQSEVRENYQAIMDSMKEWK